MKRRKENTYFLRLDTTYLPTVKILSTRHLKFQTNYHSILYTFDRIVVERSYFQSKLFEPREGSSKVKLWLTMHGYIAKHLS